MDRAQNVECMIFITTAENDADLLPEFNRRVQGIARPVDIDYGDFSFFGVWEDSVNVRVSGDRKHLGDMLKCVDDGRYVHQIQRARAAGFDHLFLVLEAVYRASPSDNIVQVKRGTHWVDAIPRTDHHRLDTYLDELGVYAGVLVKRSHSLRETVEQVINLYLMFQAPPEQHSSLNRIWTPPRPRAMDFLNRTPSLVRRWAAELPGIGWKKSGMFDKEFNSAREMANASKERLMEMEGIGKKTAEAVVKEVKHD